MKHILIAIFFIIHVTLLYSQTDIKKIAFIEGIIETVKDDSPAAFFTLILRKSNKKKYLILINSHILFYSKFSHLNYSKEFPDTLRNVLFKGELKEKDFPDLVIHKVNQKLYNKIERKNKTVRNVYNKYFREVNLPNGNKIAILNDSMSVPEIISVIAYMSNHFIYVKDDGDGMPCIYVFKE